MSRNPYVPLAWLIVILALVGGVAVAYGLIATLGRLLESVGV